MTLQGYGSLVLLVVFMDNLNMKQFKNKTHIICPMGMQTRVLVLFIAFDIHLVIILICEYN